MNEQLCLNCFGPTEGRNLWCATCIAMMRAKHEAKKQLIFDEVDKNDPVIHWSRDKGGWCFWNSTFDTEVGPFPSLGQTVNFFRSYAERLIQGRA